MTPHRPKILVIRGGAIGDFVLTLPAISALRRQFPRSRLEVLGYPRIVQLAMAAGLVDDVQPIESRALAGFFARDGNLSTDLADYFSEFDLIVSYLYDPDEIFRTNLARCSPAQFIGGPHRPNERERIHAAKAFLKPLERLAIFDADPAPRLCVQSEPPSVRPVVLHPGSGSEAKNWPEANWAELIARLIGDTDAMLLLVGGEAEGGRLERLARGRLERCQLAQSLPLTELAGRLQSCAAFVGHDSGITHLAAALDAPCCVLWADSVEEIWRPQSEKAIVIREAGGIAAISVERVFRELAILQNRDILC